MAYNLFANRISTILLDIEGTTTPIAFVYEVLFPFARVGVRKYLEDHVDEADLRQDLSHLREEHESDVRKRLDPFAGRSSYSGRHLSHIYIGIGRACPTCPPPEGEGFGGKL